MLSTASSRNILIVGLAKTGTSALYTSVKQATSGVAILEIGNPRQIAYLAQRTDVDRVSKILIQKFDELQPRLDSFTHVVRIVRDPRDVVVSWLLFRPFLHGNWDNQPYVDALVELLRKKEDDPHAVPLAAFREVHHDHAIPWVGPKVFRDWFDAEDRFHHRHPLTLTLRYEDFLTGSMSLAEHYLGLVVRSEVDLGSYNSFNQRSKSSGGWRHWFTPADVEEWSGVLDPYLDRYGYEVSWDLADPPTIEPRTSSEHVTRNVEKLRREPPSTGWSRPAATYTPSYVDDLRSALDDGREPAMIELALAHRYGWGVDVNRPRSREILLDVAARGNGIAMAHLVVDFQNGIGGPADPEQAAHHEQRLRELPEPPRRADRSLERARAEWDEFGP